MQTKLKINPKRRLGNTSISDFFKPKVCNTDGNNNASSSVISEDSEQGKAMTVTNALCLQLSQYVLKFDNLWKYFHRGSDPPFYFEIPTFFRPSREFPPFLQKLATSL